MELRLLDLSTLASFQEDASARGPPVCLQNQHLSHRNDGGGNYSRLMMLHQCEVNRVSKGAEDSGVMNSKSQASVVGEALLLNRAVSERRKLPK